MEKKRRRPYWRRTKMHLFAGLAFPALFMLIVPLFAEPLNQERFWGFPLGYLLVSHGVVIIGILAVLRFINRQDSVDRWHGAHEDV